MTRTFWQALFGGTFFVAPLLMAQPATAETLFHRAENQVPVAIVEIKRPPEHTEIHLQAQAALTKVCVAASGPNSPYLLASGRNYRYVGGENITACPERRDYAASEPGRGSDSTSLTVRSGCRASSRTVAQPILRR